MICKQHLPFIANQVITLHLSNHRETPEQINLFYSYIPSFNIFTHLRSLTLSNLHSCKILSNIVSEFQYLCNLTHLYFNSCSFPTNQISSQLIVDKIWSLSKLTNCQFGIDVKCRHQFSMPTIISTSLEFLTISHGKFKWRQINRLYYYTPRLKYFSTDITSFTDNDNVVTSLPTLIKLNLLSFPNPSTSRLVSLCQSMSNLRHLHITMLYRLIDGHVWEHIISNHLPKLQMFRLQMQENFVILDNTSTIRERVDRLINSFRNSFWINEHRWFVRCLTQDTTIHLYTLPNVSDYYKDIYPDTWKSTHPDDNQQEFYNRVTTIYNETFFNQSISSDIRLPNIDYLRIKLPINDRFWSIVPSLYHLHTLIVSSYTDTFQSQLQILLDRAPCLRSIRFSQSAALSWQIPFQCTTTSVRSLNFYDSTHSFNQETCIKLSRSLLGTQCEVLWISVKNRSSIINLLKNMRNLRVLIVECTNATYRERSISAGKNDEIIQWLQDRLPSTYLIVKDPNIDSNIIIWM